MNFEPLLLILTALSLQICRGEDPEVNMNVSQIIEYWGYPVENYDVVTADGYILSVQRIPHGKSGRKRNAPKRVVFLQHGLLGSATHFLLNPPNSSLGFILAEKGFDVWLGNSRGNVYSRRHKTLSPQSDAFWDFSWDDFAKYDLPATLNFVLTTTGVSSLSYIGHSQGTTIAFAEFSRNQTWASKVDIFIALAPVSYVGNMISPIRYLTPFTKEVEFLFEIFGVRDFALPPKIQDWLAEILCDKAFLRPFCLNVAFLLCGFDPAQLNKTRMPVYAAHIPDGTSVKDIVHWAQMVRSKKFCMYDYGCSGNKEHYGQETPPSYLPSNVTVPTAIFSGGNDWLADPKDVAILRPELKNLVFNKNIKVWDHLDFIAGRDAPALIYHDILNLLLKYYNTAGHQLRKNRLP